MRAPLSSCQVQEKETERKCFQGQECPWGWEETMPGRETLMLTWNGTRSWSSWPPGPPGATGQCFPKTALWLRTPQNVPFSHWPLGMQAPVSSHCLPPNSSASHGPSHQCCSHSPPGEAPEQGTGRAGGSEGDLVTRAGPCRRRGDFCSPFLQCFSQHWQPQAPGNVVSFCFLEVNINPGCSPGMAKTAPSALRALPGSWGRGRWQQEADVTHGCLRSGQNSGATCVCHGSRAATPLLTRARRQCRQAANLQGRGRKGVRNAGGRKAPDLSKLQPPLALLASLLKHFHFQRNQPIQSSQARSSRGSIGPPGPEPQPHQPC